MTACFSLLLLIAFGLQPGRGTQSVNTKIEITAGGSPKAVRRTDLQAAVLPIPTSVSSDSELSHKILRTGAQDFVVATEESNSPSLVEQSMRRGGAQDPIKFDPAHSLFVGAPQEPAESGTTSEAKSKPDTKSNEDEVVEVASASEPESETEDLVGAASVVDKVRLCGQKCADVVIEGGAPCDAFFASGCKGPPPKGFTADSTLYELCPIACGPKPEEFSSSLVWLVVLLLVLFVPCIIIGIAAVVIKIFFPKSYEEYSAKAQQVFKDGKKRWNAVTSGGEYYDEWSDEGEGTDDDNDDYDLVASAVMEESQSQFASQSMSGTTMMPGGSATTMMPGASATTMMPGASATTMMPGGSATTMMPSGTTMMPTMMASSATMMPTMMQSSATMMQSGMMEEQPTMMGTMMGSSVMEEQPTMMGTMMGSSVMESGVNLSSTDTL